MASIPLLCNICPREPDFSDLSHLLTHIASKGHLSHYFKAQVRARQDQTIRHKLDTYDQWYRQHNVEKLLSQRMISKDSKDANSRVKPESKVQSSLAKPARSTKTRGRRVKVPPEVENGLSPVKAEDSIDPQLSLPLPPTACEPSRFLYLPRHDSASQHRAHVPHMCDLQHDDLNQRQSPDSPSPQDPYIRQPLHDFGDNTGSEGDYFRTFIRSSSKMAYPDPSELTSTVDGFSIKQDDKNLIRRHTSIHQTTEPDKADLVQSPVLKGVKWPGMSLFDSASLEAQRMRNQRKDESILERMEQNSNVVEQMEYIYWPEGGLKKKRMITGNVESSPAKDPSPPPKPSRAKPSKGVLKEMSINGPNLTKKRRIRHTTGGFPAKQASYLEDISNKALVSIESPQSPYPEDPYATYELGDDFENERRLTGGHAFTSRGQAFQIFKDEHNIKARKAAKPNQKNGNAIDSPLLSRPYGHRGSSSLRTADSISRAMAFPMRKPHSSTPQPYVARWGPRPRSFPKVNTLCSVQGKENEKPTLDNKENTDDEAAEYSDARVTQRYFSVTAGQPPQFFSAMPPQMDFGGMAGPVLRGATLNPLNPYLRHGGFQPQYPHSSFGHPVQESVLNNGDEVANAIQKRLGT